MTTLGRLQLMKTKTITTRMAAMPWSLFCRDVFSHCQVSATLQPHLHSSCCHHLFPLQHSKVQYHLLYHQLWRQLQFCPIFAFSDFYSYLQTLVSTLLKIIFQILWTQDLLESEWFWNPWCQHIRCLLSPGLFSSCGKHFWSIFDWQVGNQTILTCEVSVCTTELRRDIRWCVLAFSFLLNTQGKFVRLRKVPKSQIKR